MLLLEIEEVSLSEPDHERLWGCHIDLPEAGTRAEAPGLDVMGWVLGKGSPAVAVELVHGGTVLRRVPLNHRRPDVAEAFPGVPGAERSGFRATVSALGADPELELGVRAVLRDQRRAPIGTIRGRRRWSEGDDERAGAALVSVVIPCHNQARFLGEAIESALAQSYPHLEVVVVDDGSTDNTQEVAARYPGVRCVRQENRGLAGARNAGIRRTNGSHLVFLDADDRLLPGALGAGLRALEGHPECAFAAGRCRFVAFDGSPLPTPAQPSVREDHYLALLSYNHIWITATVVFRRAALEAVGVFDGSVGPSADYDLYLRIARDHPVRCHDGVVAEYRRHGTNMTRNSALMLGAVVTTLRRQWPYVKGDSRYKEAYKAGMRFWRNLHGEPSVEQVRAHIEAEEWGQTIRGLLVLLRYHPRGFASVLTGTDTHSSDTDHAINYSN